MIDIRQFESIKAKYGAYASWAVWADAGAKPKSNVGCLEHFDSEGVLELLKNNVVMVGLNVSRAITDPVPEAFRNFHSPYPRAHDFKIRYAFKGSEYYGAYMTDIIKCLPELDSRKVMEQLTPDVIEENVRRFQEEMNDLQATVPLILAFGGNTNTLLKRHYLPTNPGAKLIKIPHYSDWRNKEKYKRDVFREIASALATNA